MWDEEFPGGGDWCEGGAETSAVRDGEGGLLTECAGSGCVTGGCIEVSTGASAFLESPFVGPSFALDSDDPVSALSILAINTPTSSRRCCVLQKATSFASGLCDNVSLQ